MKKLLGTLLAFFIFTSCSSTKDITYKLNEKEFKGYIASAKKGKGLRPGIIVVHEWWGHNEYARKRADMLAKEGYTAMAVDMYGDGKLAIHPKDAGQFAKAVMKDPKAAQERFKKALEVLKSQPDVDPNKISAIGYCFGGAIVLNMARKGVKLDSVVSFHGSLKSPIKMKTGKFKGKVLVLNGEADPMIKKSDIRNFKREMKNANVDYKFVNYPKAKHAFTNPMADEFGRKFKLPLGYDKEADEDSWNQMIQLFNEIY